MNTRASVCRLAADEPRAYQSLGHGRTRIQLPEDLGRCFHDFLELESGLGLGRLHYHPLQSLVEETNGPHRGRVMVVTIGLQGRSSYLGQDATRLEFQAGHTTITAFQAIPGERRYEAGDTVAQLRIVADEQLIRKYLGDTRTIQLFGNSRLNRLAFRAGSPMTLSHAAALLRHLQADQEAPSRLDLHIHALSLLNEQFNLLAPRQDAASCAMAPRDLERIEHARDMLAEHLDKPLTLDYLATTTGLNKNKLKEGFLHLYGSTPAELLLELRMRKAHALLEAGQQVSQAAWQVGYKYANNFTVAFTRYYGQSPKAIFGKRVEDR